MATSFSNLFQGDYASRLPTEIPKKAAQGAIVTAVVSVICGFGIYSTVLGAGLAATATLVEAVTRPVIRLIFPENPNIAVCIQIAVPYALVLGVGACVAPWIGAANGITSLFFSAIGWLALNRGSYEKNIAMAAVL